MLVMMIMSGMSMIVLMLMVGMVVIMFMLMLMVMIMIPGFQYDETIVIIIASAGIAHDIDFIL